MSTEEIARLEPFFDLLKNVDGCVDPEQLKKVFAPCAAVFLKPIAENSAVYGYKKMLESISLKSSKWQEVLSLLWAVQYFVAGPSAKTAFVDSVFVNASSHVTLTDIIFDAMTNPSYESVRGQIADCACAIILGLELNVLVNGTGFSSEFASKLVSRIDSVEKSTQIKNPNQKAALVSTLLDFFSRLDDSTGNSLPFSIIESLLDVVMLSTSTAVRAAAITYIVPKAIQRKASDSATVTAAVVRLLRTLTVQGHKLASESIALATEVAEHINATNQKGGRAAATLTKAELKAKQERAKDIGASAKNLRKDCLALLVAAVAVLDGEEFANARFNPALFPGEVVSLDSVDEKGHSAAQKLGAQVVSKTQGVTATAANDLEGEETSWATCSAPRLVWSLVHAGLADADMTTRKRARYFISSLVEQVNTAAKVTSESSVAVGTPRWHRAWLATLDLMDAAEEFAAHLLKQQWLGLADLCEAAAQTTADFRADIHSGQAPVLLYTPMWLEALLQRCLSHANANTFRFVTASLLSLLADGRQGLLMSLQESGKGVTGDAQARRALKAECLSAEEGQQRGIHVAFSKNFFFDFLVPKLCTPSLYGRADAGQVESACKAAVTAYIAPDDATLQQDRGSVARLFVATARHARHFTPLRVLLEAMLRTPKAAHASGQFSTCEMRSAVMLLSKLVRHFPVALRGPMATLVLKVVAKHAQPNAISVSAVAALFASLPPAGIAQLTQRHLPSQQSVTAVKGDRELLTAMASLVAFLDPPAVHDVTLRLQAVICGDKPASSIVTPDEQRPAQELLTVCRNDSIEFATWLEDNLSLLSLSAVTHDGSRAQLQRLDDATEHVVSKYPFHVADVFARGIARIAAVSANPQLQRRIMQAVLTPLSGVAANTYVSAAKVAQQLTLLDSILLAFPASLVDQLAGPSAFAIRRQGASTTDATAETFAVSANHDLFAVAVSLLEYAEVVLARAEESLASAEPADVPAAVRDALVVIPPLCKVLSDLPSALTESLQMHSVDRLPIDVAVRIIKQTMRLCAVLDIGTVTAETDVVRPNAEGAKFVARSLALATLSASVSLLLPCITAKHALTAQSAVSEDVSALLTTVLNLLVDYDIPSYKFDRDFAAQYSPLRTSHPSSPSQLDLVVCWEALTVKEHCSRDGRLHDFTNWRDVYELAYRAQYDALTSLGASMPSLAALGIPVDTPAASLQLPGLGARVVTHLLDNPPTNLWGVMSHFFQMVASFAWPVVLPPVDDAQRHPLVSFDASTTNETQIQALRKVASLAVDAAEAHKDAHLPLWLIQTTCLSVLHPQALVAESKLLPISDVEETSRADPSRGVWKPIIRNKLQIEAQTKLKRDANCRGGDKSDPTYVSNVQAVSQPCMQFAVRALEHGLITVGIARGVTVGLLTAISHLHESEASASLVDGPLSRLLAELLVFREASVEDGDEHVAPDPYSPEALLALHERVGLLSTDAISEMERAKLGDAMCTVQLHAGPTYSRLLTLAALEVMAERSGLCAVDEAVNSVVPGSETLTSTVDVRDMGVRFIKTNHVARMHKDGNAPTPTLTRAQEGQARLLDAVGLHLVSLIRCTLEKICNPEFGQERKGAGRIGQTTPMPDSYYHRVQLRAWQAVACLARALVNTPRAGKALMELAVEHLMSAHLPDVRHYIETTCAVLSAFDLEGILAAMQATAEAGQVSGADVDMTTGACSATFQDLPVQVVSSILIVLGYPLVAVAKTKAELGDFRSEAAVAAGITAAEAATADKIVDTCWGVLRGLSGYLTCNAAYVRGVAQLIVHDFLEAFAIAAVNQPDAPAKSFPNAVEASVTCALATIEGQSAANGPVDGIFIRSIFRYLHCAKEAIKMRQRTKLLFHTFDPLLDARLGRLLPSEGIVPLRTFVNSAALGDAALVGEREGPCELEDCELKPAWSLVASIKAAVTAEMSSAWHSEEGDINMDAAVSAAREARQRLALQGQAAEEEDGEAPAKRAKTEEADGDEKPSSGAGASSIDATKAAVQRKFEPWQNQLPNVDSSSGRSSGCATDGRELIVVASLVNRVPNLAGLCRTCEIFKASLLVLPNKKLVNDPAFQSVSVTAHQWMNVDECTPKDLPAYLRGLKARGFELVGLEQTETGGKLGHTWNFPKKVALVLGAEKEGLSAELIAMLDHCVEIPQAGIIRSLNVHVAASLCIWEFVRQAHEAAGFTGRKGVPAAIEDVTDVKME